MQRVSNRTGHAPGIVVLAFVCCWIPSVAAAQVAAGVRAGASVDPDQFFLGVHLETDPLVDRLVFRPNVEVGFGDNVTLAALNFEFAWKLPRRGEWGFYAGGGPAINLYQVEGPGDDARGGANILVGLESRGRFFFEFKIGLSDSPDLKFGVGYTFR